MKENKQLLVLTHLSQLSDMLVPGIGGFIVPLIIIWLTKKNEIYGMDTHGKAILNFRITMYIFLLLCVPLVFICGIGIIGFILIGVVYLIYPIINAIRVSNGQEPNYPFKNIQFIK